MGARSEAAALRNGRFMGRQRKRETEGERGERNEEKMGEAQMTSRQSGMRRQGKKKSALVVGWLWRVGALLGSCAGVGRAALLVRGI